MNGSQQSPATTHPSYCEPANDAARWFFEGENEIPLGWECANPALQIERWGQEAPPASPQSC